MEIQPVDRSQHTHPLAKDLNEIGAINSIRFIVHEDNKAAITIISHQVRGEQKVSTFQSSRNKMLDDETLEMRYCYTEDMTADVTTKGMLDKPYI